MVDKEVRFRVLIDDQATAELKRIIEEIKKFSQSSASATVGVTQGAVGVPGGGSGGATAPDSPNVPKAPSTPKAPSATKGKGDPNAQIPGEWARPLRAAGMYRTAWLAGQDLSGKGPGGMAMAGAAGIFIFKAIGEGIGKIVEILQQASPALRAELKIIGKIINLVLQPIGDLLAATLRPIARAMMTNTATIRSVMKEQGFTPGTAEYTSKYLSQSLKGFGKALTGGVLTEGDVEFGVGKPGQMSAEEMAF
jgi:hypothetical protein